MKLLWIAFIIPVYTYNFLPRLIGFPLNFGSNIKWIQANLSNSILPEIVGKPMVLERLKVN